MKKYTLQLVVPPKLCGIKQEVEKIQHYGDEQVLIIVNGVCDDLRAFQEWARMKEVPDFILVFERIVNVRINKEGAREELLSAISDLCFSGSKIICILSEEEQEELLPFVNELIKLDLQNFYFATEFRTENLVEWIFENKTLQDNIPYVVRQTRPTVVENKIAGFVEKEVPVEVIREVIKEVPIEIEKEVIREVPIEVEKEVIREVEREVIREVPVERIVEKKVYVPGKILGSVSIGIINLAHGAGATTAAVSLAESFARDGYATAVIAMDGKTDLHYLNKKRLKADYVVPGKGDNKELEFLQLRQQNYPFIIQDFGNLLEIAPDGQIKTELLIGEKKDDFTEFTLRCTYKVVVGFYDDWNIRKLDSFLDNAKLDWDTFFFCIRGGGNELRKYNLNLCSGYDAIADMIRQQAGLEQERKEKRSAFPFLFQ